MTDDNDADIRAMMRALGRLEGKIDAMVAHTTTLHAENKDIKAQHQRLLRRVGTIEGRINLYAGGIAVLVPILVFIAEPLAKVVFNG